MVAYDKPDTLITVRIPSAVASASHDIRRFIDAMMLKLEKNAHKGKWEGLSIDDAFMRLEDEITELRAEVKYGPGNSMKTVLEAADVANFALIIASIAIERGK
jgi:hypothetical protein